MAIFLAVSVGIKHGIGGKTAAAMGDGIHWHTDRGIRTEQKSTRQKKGLWKEEEKIFFWPSSENFVQWYSNNKIYNFVRQNRMVGFERAHYSL